VSERIVSFSSNSSHSLSPLCRRHSSLSPPSLQLAGPLYLTGCRAWPWRLPSLRLPPSTTSTPPSVTPVVGGLPLSKVLKNMTNHLLSAHYGILQELHHQKSFGITQEEQSKLRLASFITVNQVDNVASA
jgi:hypothetical protein